MLIRFFDDFVNFTGVNSYFLSPRFKCKHPPEGKNRRFTSPPYHFETQMGAGSQRWISCWRNTIFGFLDAQLNFLAIFSTPPHNSTKYEILSDSSGFEICQETTKHYYLQMFYAIFHWSCLIGFLILKN